ncbi:S8 family serine peptidase [Dyadobacter sediminis]|uniref:T9SS type A sorting domain-containing protein n=1 Tax=Dyadobacter sediminis TaxID=1493691 RepID=A0A5R9K8I9_9BACT|nr:S8 family serine peptidase [Dyadobacter sediminis]TLU90409.1 T9SS type A sorting domain-containing protein [Dyadobacter sediminis]GGC07530.1 hypothetical protein GCM10011325_38050 [Dyadobacter sediminis]
MKLKNVYHTLVFFHLVSFFAFSQEAKDYRILLKSGSFTPQKNILFNKNQQVNAKHSAVDSKELVIIQFEAIPDQKTRDQLKQEGIELLEYIPNYAYTAVISGSSENALARMGGRSVIALSPEQKMQPELANGLIPAFAVQRAGTVDVWINYPKAFQFKEVTDQLKERHFEILSDQFKDHQIISLRVDVERLTELASLSFIQYVQAIPPGDKAFNDKSTVNARANMLHSARNGRPDLSGKGVTVGVGDESNPLQHIDFSGRIINRTPAEEGSHGLHVMGTLAGAGIVNEKYAGYAPKAKLVVQEYSRILAYAPVYVKDFGMVITNNSYGGDVNNCETFGTYDLYSRILDEQAFQMPYLQHVFASGNSGSVACSPYPTGFANVLSGYQTAKNVISVGNTSALGLIANGSSRGPVRDGRIKPEITAQGSAVISTVPVNNYGNATGTSMSSPAVAGGLALLYERYRQLHQNLNPKNALMKALVCNGGTDKGNEGPDYKYGFGWLNLERSIQMLENNHYRNDSVSHQNTKLHTIAVPANTAELKVMLYWNDPAAAILSAQNLVNDLDLSVTDPWSAVTLPRLLDPTPANVNNVAITGIDKINNAEQVVIRNPAAGTYTISVKGSSIGQNPNQEYFVVYDVIPNAVQLTYPIGNERLKDGDAISVSWDSYGNPSTTFTVQYSLDNGVQWSNIAQNLAANVRQFSWTVPAAATTDKARVRVIQNSTGMESASEPFTILGIPAVSLSAVQCEDYISLDWTPVAGATDYEVMLLKGDEMISTGTTLSTNYVLSGMNSDSTYFLSVRARLNGHPGRRALAVSRKPDSGTCDGTVSDNDLKMEAILSPARLGRKNTSTQFTGNSLVKIRIRNLDDADSKVPFNVGYTLNGVSSSLETISPVIEKGKTYDHTFSIAADLSNAGNYVLTVFLSKANDNVVANDTLSATIRHFPNDPVTLPFTDNMEALPVQTVQAVPNEISGIGRYDFSSTSDAGRLRTFVNSGIAFSGEKALTLDANRYFASGNINFLDATFNLAAYDVASKDIRVSFRYKNHGQKEGIGNKVWIRGKETDPWIEAFDLFENQNLPENGYKMAPAIEVSNLLLDNNKFLTSGFQVRFGQNGNTIAADYTSGAGYTFDDISIFTVTDDIQVLALITPLAENCGSGTQEPITVQVKNSSSGDITNIPVFYQLNNGAVISEVIPFIQKRTTLNFTFTNKADLTTFGSYNLKVWTALASDNYHLNDSLKTEFHNAPVISTFPYLQNFETDDGFWYSRGTNNSWQYGIPASAQISHAASGRKAWKTNLAGNYNDKEDSYLYSPCFAVSGLAAPALSFSVALDLEVCNPDACDFVYIEYSGNGGKWTRLGAAGQGTNWYNKTYSGQSMWSVQDYSRWHVASIPLPTGFADLKLRFVMHSDNFTHRDGIAIDDIHIYDKTNSIYDGATMNTAVTQNIPGNNNWVHFTENGKRIASVNANGQNLGNTEVQAYIHAGTVRSANGQYYLDRNISIKPANGNLTDSAAVRLYFLDKESEMLINASGCNDCEKPSEAYELAVSKYSHTDQSKEDGNLDNNVAGNWNFLASSKVAKVPFEQGYYAEFKVKDFSEFWFARKFVGPAGALPVDLVWFTVEKSEQDGAYQAVLAWETAFEEHFDHFEIELAKGDEAYRLNRFTSLTSVPGNGTLHTGQKYTFTDGNITETGNRYYRLKMVDADGSFQYSSVKTVVFDGKIKWNVYPNPSLGIFNVTYKAEKGQRVTFKIYDLNGRLCSNASSEATGLVQKQPVDLAEQVRGLYFIEVKTEKEKQVFKVVKE